MSNQLIIRIDENAKQKLTKLAKAEGKTNSQVVRELINIYITERDISGYIDDLWERTGKKLKRKGIKPSDVNKVIRDVRAAKNANSD